MRAALSAWTVLVAAAVVAALISTAQCSPVAARSYLSRLCAFGHAHHGAGLDQQQLRQCRYGWEIDSCGHKTCTKGPGEMCGGKHAIYGICGEGLTCSNCNRCTGCSLRSFDCFEDRMCML